MKPTDSIPRARFALLSLSLCASVALFVSAAVEAPRAQGPYFPGKGEWARKAPGEVGMDAAKLDAAVAFAKTRETNWPRDFSTQEKIF